MVGPVGGSEVLLIFVLALLLFGPRKLPEIGRSIGRTMGQLRKATTDFRMDLEREIKVEELQQTRKDLGAVEQEISKAAAEIRDVGRVADVDPGTGRDGSSTEPR